MKENLITFETAKLAKEKSFDLEVISYFETDGSIKETQWGSMWDVITYENQDDGLLIWKEDYNIHEDLYSRPTQSLLQDWLLEKHGYFVTVELAYNEWGRYSANVQKQAKDGKTAIIALDGFTIYDNLYDALEEGLQEALKLI